MKPAFAMAASFALSLPAMAQTHHPPSNTSASQALNGQRLPFSTAVRAGDTLYLSGALGIGPDGKLAEGMEAQARQTMDNIEAALKSAGLGWADVVKCTVMLDNMADWPAFNKVYATYFPGGKFPARSAFGADGLALGALLEVECMAYAGKKLGNARRAALTGAVVTAELPPNGHESDRLTVSFSPTSRSIDSRLHPSGRPANRRPAIAW